MTRGNKVKGKYTIGIVDDTRTMRAATERLFNAAGDFYVKSGENGIEAVELVELGGISAMVVDYKMPEMDGAEAIAEIKKRNGNIIAILNSTSDAACIAEACGADAYVNKFSLANSELPQIVRELVEERYSATLERCAAENELSCWQKPMERRQNQKKGAKNLSTN